MTASEPLTIEEEYAMQQEWMEDSESKYNELWGNEFYD